MGLSFGLGPATEKNEAIGARPSTAGSRCSTPPKAMAFINEELVGDALEPVRHHVENLAAAELELTASEMREIDEAFSMIDIKTRCPRRWSRISTAREHRACRGDGLLPSRQRAVRRTVSVAT